MESPLTGTELIGAAAGKGAGSEMENAVGFSCE